MTRSYRARFEGLPVLVTPCGRCGALNICTHETDPYRQKKRLARWPDLPEAEALALSRVPSIAADRLTGSSPPGNPHAPHQRSREAMLADGLPGGAITTAKWQQQTLPLG